MNFKSKADMYFRLKRLFRLQRYGIFFKVIFTYNSENIKFSGFLIMFLFKKIKNK